MAIESRAMLLVASLALCFVAQDPPGDSPGVLSYDNGLRAEMKSGSAWARLNGRWMHDWGDVPPAWRAEPGVSDETRRLRLILLGEWGSRLAFKTQGEFKHGDPHLLEWLVDWKSPDRPDVRVGHFREPFGLDARTSSAHLSFVERAAPTQALTFGRNRGLTVRRSNLGSSWALGAFREAGGLADEGLLDNTAITGRATWLPLGSVADTDQGDFIHLGLSATYRDTRADGIRLTADPEIHLARRAGDTGTIAADSAAGLIVESAWVRGILTTQAELFLTRLDQTGGGHALMNGGYVQVAAVLTGERRSYRESTRSFGGLPVQHPTLGAGGSGAWEVGGRYSRTDLDDGVIQGGVVDNFTLGLTWHLNSNTRWMINHVQTSGGAGDEGLLAIRLQTGF